MAVNQLDQTEARWFAVYTRFRREKLVVERLKRQGIEAYLPLQHFTRRYTRKVRQVALPLISCYVFVKIAKPEYLSVLRTPDVVGFVKISKDLIAIPEAEIRLMQRIVGEVEVEIEAKPLVLQKGDPVEIIGGQLTGLKGKLVDCPNGKNFLIELTSVGYTLQMEVPPAFLCKISPTGIRAALS